MPRIRLGFIFEVCHCFRQPPSPPTSLSLSSSWSRVERIAGGWGRFAAMWNFVGSAWERWRVCVRVCFWVRLCVCAALKMGCSGWSEEHRRQEIVHWKQALSPVRGVGDVNRSRSRSDRLWAAGSSVPVGAKVWWPTSEKSISEVYSLPAWPKSKWLSVLSLCLYMYKKCKF